MTDIADWPERPESSTGNSVWGSDAIAEMLRALGFRWIALNPGASFRGLHDSLVNHLGNRDPRMLLCLHENAAVSIAQGYAKVAGEPMAVALHSNVGLLNGSMAVFNAWCDRVPVMIIGATGPVDAAKRRPWIDWLHTVQDQGALVRHFVKWDAQPVSVDAAFEALLRADILMRAAPRAPVCVTLDSAVQEMPLPELPAIPDPARFRGPSQPSPSAEAVSQAARILSEAKRPVILAGRVSRGLAAWGRRVALAEALSARVLSGANQGAAFPTDHPLATGKPGVFLDAEGGEALCSADAILSLDWLDLGGTLKQAGEVSARVIQCSLDHLLHNGFGGEHHSLPPCDLHLPCEPDVAAGLIADALGIGPGAPPAELPACSAIPMPADDTPLDVAALAAALGEALKGQPTCLVRIPLGWQPGAWHLRHPLDSLGGDGGAGIGGGPGILVGAALALKGSGRIPLGILGDGDTMMGVQAFWTAARYGIPLLAVVSNNRSFFNDEIHQERMARQRGRPVGNKWIGQAITGPDIEFAALARAQGIEGIGPVHTAGELHDAVRRAVALVRKGRAVLVDARVAAGYSAAMTAGLTRETGRSPADRRIDRR
jgi:thiamine pyrophosphate-dependent acetolactate synthase large subunit-like protein